MRRLWPFAVGVIVAVCLSGAPAIAQDNTATSDGQAQSEVADGAQDAQVDAELTAPNLRSPVLVLDYPGLFARSLYGQRVQSEIEAEGRALVEENDRIEAELSAEELLLTSQRDDLSAEEFRALADAFDEKVQRMRSQQDAKARAVGQGREAEERRFRQLVTPIIARIMQETGAAVVIERSQAIVWAEVVDITPVVLAQVDRVLGADPGAPPAREAPQARQIPQAAQNPED